MTRALDSTSDLVPDTAKRGEVPPRRWVRVVLTLALLTVGTPRPEARADATADQKAAAARLINEGNALFDAGSYERALEKYEEAHQTYPSPKIRFNLGEALHALGRDLEAAEAYTELLESGAVTPDSRLALESTKRLAELDAKLGRLLVRGPEDAQVELDEKPLERRPGRVVRVTPGSHRLSARREGALPFARTLEIAPGEEVAVDLAFVAAPVEVATPAPPAAVATAQVESTSPPWWLWVAIGGVAVTGAVVTVIAVTTGGDDRRPMGELPETSTADWMRF